MMSDINLDKLLRDYAKQQPDDRVLSEEERSQLQEKLKVETEGRDAEPQSATSINDSIEGYEILSEIQRGGQGVVYKAVQEATKRTVALKVLLEGPYASAKQRHRFEREIDLVAGLQHPNIVTVYDSGVTREERHYFAMEYVRGRPLDAYLSDTNLGIDETLRLFRKICTAVSYAHLRGVIHRDLKPGNIRIDAEGEPHVLDFGLAKAAGPALQGGAPVTLTGEFMGTLAYASPEQTKGDPHLIDIRTDVYSLGVVLYEMLTGKYPYEVAGQMADVFRNIAEAQPKRPSTVRRQINDEVETIVLKALAKDPQRRYQSAENLARDIEYYLNGEPIDAKRDSTWYVIRKSLRRYRVAAGVGMAFVLLLCMSTIALWFMFQNQSRAREEAEFARAEVQMRVDELKTVSKFHQSLPGDIAADDARSVFAADLDGDGDIDAISASEEDDKIAWYENNGDSPLKWGNLVISPRAALPAFSASALDGKIAWSESDGGLPPPTGVQYSMTAPVPAWPAYKSADRYFREALEGRRRVLGDDHPDTLTSVSNMGVLLMAMGKHRMAFPYYREALEGRRRVLGDDHRDTLNSINNTGELLSLMGKYAEAEPYFREALEGSRRVLGDDHPTTLILINNMGALLSWMGKYEEAFPFLRDELDRKRRVQGEEHPDTLISIHHMGRLMRDLGRLKEAEDLGAEAVQRARSTLGEDHWHTGVFLEAYGTTLLQLQRLANAEAALRESHSILEAAIGADHMRTVKTIKRLIDLYDAWDTAEPDKGYAAKASEWRAKLPQTVDEAEAATP